LLRLVAASALIPVLAVPAAMGQVQVDSARAATPEGTIKISNARGSVRVLGWDRDSVAVRGSLDHEVERLVFVTESRETRIRVVAPRGNESAGAAALEVRVPRESHVAVRTAGAPIEVIWVSGAVDVESVSGSVVVRGQPRVLYAQTATGDLTLDASTKVLRANSVSGTIRVADARGYVQVSTVTGDVSLTGRRVWEGEITTVSGRIRFEGDFDAGGSFSFESHSGPIELVFPETVAADVELQTYGSSVENAFAPADARSFSVGGGGAAVRVKTFKGRVAIRAGPAG
jgi:hypothetical protein